MEDQFKLKMKKSQFTIVPKIVVNTQIQIESLINQLKNYGSTSQQKMSHLLDTTANLLHNEPNILYLSSPFFIVGDIHGQFYDLLYLIEKYGKFPTTRFLFLGDYVDRGLFCIETITLLLALKCKYPKNIFLLRGNHEGKAMTEHYNFKLQCLKKYNIDFYERFLQVFCQLPLAALIDNRYFCVHGGLSPQLKKLKQLNSVDRFKQIEPVGMMCDLLWSDPVNNNSTIWEKNKNRMCSYMFSKKHAEKFIKENKIQLIIRAHQLQKNGFTYQTDDLRKKLTLTIFSAPNYCNINKNKGGIAIIQKNSLRIDSFQQSPAPFVFPNYMNVLQWSLPIIAQKTSKILLHLLKGIDTQDNKLSEQEIAALSKLQGLYESLKQQKSQSFKLFSNQQIEQRTVCDQICDENIEKYPQEDLLVIGPKHIEFKRIRISDEIEIDEELLVS